MPLFKRYRDLKLFNSINYQLILKMVDTTVNVFKINSFQTNANLYGQALKKVYYPDVICAGFIEHNDPDIKYSERGLSYGQMIKVRFSRQILEQIQLYPEIGDIIQ